MPSPIYEIFRRAILEEKQVVFEYDGALRTACPLIIGHSDGAEMALVYQLEGPARPGRPAEGWRCLRLERVAIATLQDGPWREGDDHRAEQNCVAEVDLDVNIHVRGRR